MSNQLRTLLQLQAILERCRDTYWDGVLENVVSPFSSVFAAQAHGDARKAIDLFRKASEIADRESEDTVRKEHVRAAEKEAERDRTSTQCRAFGAEEALFTPPKLSLSTPSVISGVYRCGVHKEYLFIDGPEVVAETLQADIRLDDGVWRLVDLSAL
jgi:cell division control protein 6